MEDSVFINLKKTPIDASVVRSIRPIYEQPFLPVKEKYLTRMEVQLKDGTIYEFHEAEWIHPEGTDMGRVDLSTETYMITKSRISAIRIAANKQKQIGAFVVELKDGGAYVLLDGNVKLI